MQQQIFKRAMKLMGNHFELSVVAEEEEWAHHRIDAGVREIQRIETLLTTYDEGSETSLINAHAGLAPVRVSAETFALIERSIRISQVTQGAFDITYGSVDKGLWNFDTTMRALPDAATARRMVRLINYQHILLDKENHTVFLKEKGMRIGFGGIGKGYAAERAKAVMQQMGVASGVVNASGDLTAWGYQPGGEPWTIGIVNPNSAGQIFSYLNVTGLALATSGNYEKYVIIDGKRYSHTINPRTGLPVTGIKSVTILCPNAEIADAMATPVMIMGIRAGLDMINQMRDIEAILIDDDDVVYTSDHIHFSKQQQ
ncbi:FAD:protein FMN transferase [Flavitalea sp. BT771]|uniref:FAD:protein FMN transferase n=1 Tax=Flavitalea sp. BT771 TaxID=3063329 RepID=UPI0026E2506C|nr:FAD:protein FMN transferase [Flavitalea sp. BT771]MDO6429535.1 FAD:protein FMN transferase [Flavitalea sp. BT771]MDV6218337.1 FAD:protein FMN transferase [Flavitalea sp. BT771]